MRHVIKDVLTILQELFKGSIYKSNRGDKIQCAGLLYKWHFAERFEIFKSSLMYHNHHFLKVFKIDWLKLIDQNHFLLFYQCKRFILLSKSGLQTWAFIIDKAMKVLRCEWIKGLKFESIWKAPSKFRKMYKNIESKKRRNYAATATAMDSMIGDVVELYKQFGYWDNTIVVFSSGIFQNVEFVPYYMGHISIAMSSICIKIATRFIQGQNWVT